MPKINCYCGKTATFRDVWNAYASNWEICPKTLQVFCDNCTNGKTFTCQICKTIKVCTKSKKRKFCSRACYIAYSRQLPTSQYKRVWHNGKRVYLHRLIYEQHSGKPLEPDAIIHHIDGNKTNNDPSNLEKLTGKAAHLHCHNYHRRSDRTFNDECPF